MRKANKKGKVWFDKDVIYSPAFCELPGTASKVYIYFLAKRRMVKQGRKGYEEWIIGNNGEITFTYNEAEKLGLSRPTFRTAIDNLIKFGFIDIEYSGNAFIKGDCSKYTVSERWMAWGTENFKKLVRQKDYRYKKKKGGSIKQNISNDLLPESSKDLLLKNKS